MKGLFGLMAIGLIMVIIGIGTKTEWVFYAGAVILPLIALWAGLFNEEIDTPIKTALVGISGFMMAAIILLFSGVSLLSY